MSTWKDDIKKHIPFFSWGGKIPLSCIGGDVVPLTTGAVISDYIAAGAVIAAAIGSKAVTTAKINDGAVTALQLGAAAVGKAALNTATLTGTTHATPGTGVNVAHGITGTPTCFVAIGNAYIDSVDATNVVIKSAGISQACTIIAIKP